MITKLDVGSLLKFPNMLSSLVSNSGDEMSKFVTGVSVDLEEECQAAMLHDSMDLARLMIPYMSSLFLFIHC